MSKKSKTFFVLFGVIVIFLGTFCALQWNNIVAVYKVISTTDEQLEEEINGNKQALETELKKKYPTIISDFSAEEEAKIIKGELSAEQAVNELKKKYEAKKDEIKSGTTQTELINNEEIDELIGDKVIELYSLKAYYLGQLGQMEATVKREYLAMPKEKRNLVGKQELVSKYMGMAISLMNQCDAQVEELVSKLEAELKALGDDAAIVKTIKAAYEDEKALKKAQYLKLLKE